MKMAEQKGVAVSEIMRPKSFHIITFGCQMNQHDSEAIEGALLNAGYVPAGAVDSADIILFNTCCVRDHAEQRLYSRISQLQHLKGQRPGLILGIGGCVAQKEKESLPQKFPQIDLVFGTNAVYDIVSLIERAAHGEKPVVSTPEDGPALRADAYSAHVPGRYHAWVSVMRGCDNYCSYCIVPYVRGAQRSKHPEEVVEEVERLVQRGVKEVTLLGQNVNSYGQDLGCETTFSKLLQRLDQIEGLLRIRFTTSHPKDISADLMRAFRELPTVCEHLHLPVQSGSSRILRLMNRGYTAQRYLETAAKLREYVPDIALTTDVIVGFPGETDDDFEATRALLDEIRFDGAYIFKYSPRQGTAAALMEGAIAREIVKRRHHVLLDLQKRISQERLAQLLGTQQTVLPEQPDKKRAGHLMGKTRGHRTASFFAPPSLDLFGKEISVRVFRIDGWTLIGEMSLKKE
ncbi:MAG: tRNA (N6-isopentenyl adenosine(37)-C2)-methylthiotransferase MiaB [Candidatus Abyssobacteria bacterium SURF_5]|uniref:tRNA-2-methylthio-N(6)-dimethylallyladenosine synthase n=1 Tax=Abyssobacteria bacterium (strain SURF_5) TaxID=2093360 RepID=A0A3A4NNS2_ABYX5|nr:MAG: tRNA (N6-isopentenyl adenosine(37)-C2)-methylthiotransferase MiaB [Candidatus Abyssubacteria bacterium SURF_5]